MAQGIDTVITNGAHPEALCDIVAGRAAGALFAGRKRILDGIPEMVMCRSHGPCG